MNKIRNRVTKEIITQGNKSLKNLCEDAVSGNASLRLAYLLGANLSGANLSKANLTEVDLAAPYGCLRGKLKLVTDK